MMYYSYTQTFTLVYCIAGIVIVCLFVRSLMAFFCQLIKGLLTCLLTYLLTYVLEVSARSFSNNEQCVVKLSRVHIFRPVLEDEGEFVGPVLSMFKEEWTYHIKFGEGIGQSLPLHEFVYFRYVINFGLFTFVKANEWIRFN